MANLLQFGLSASKGTLVRGKDLPICKFYSSTATDKISGGLVVKISAGSGNAVPSVTSVELADKSDADQYGVVVNNVVKAEHVVGEMVEVAVCGDEVIMEAGDSITAGSQVAFDSSTGKVETLGSSEYAIGIAQESASADGDLIRVLITVTGALGVAGT